MISFFRKIRQSLIRQNKVTRYLVYAIGEIVLVVIGILIALSINNANDTRKERKELNNYLLKISNDVNRDIEQIAGLKIRRDYVREKAIQSFKLLLKNDFSNIELIREGGICFIDFYFIPNKSGFEAIKSSTYLGEINNTKLDSLLTGYYALVDLIENREKGFNAFIEEMEAELNKSVDVLPSRATNSARWEQELLGMDSTNSNWKKRFDEVILERISHNAFKAAIARTSEDFTYESRYENLVDLGKNLVDEINDEIRRLEK
ncbi:DUF6090 family protein [Algoriphagus sp.]|uniref:DUF6090 family protein n=1 Tax=Algoriphagus sp. TaxID=1872435 RepID=UPI0025F77C39|nr:DUF6090 family protein [Algoriphagus sp.]